MGFKHLDQFNRNFQRRVEQLGEEKIVVYHQHVHMTLLRQLIMGNPVDTGRSQNAWQSSISKPTETEAPPPVLVTDKGAAVEMALSRAQQALAALGPFDSSWIYNNVDYVPYLEAGHSPQASSGWIDAALQRLGEGLGRVA